MLDLSLTHLLAIQMRVGVIQKLQGWRALLGDHPPASQGLLVVSLLRVYHHPPVTEAALLQHSVLLLRSDLWGGLSLFPRSSHADAPGWSLSAAGPLCCVGFCPWGRLSLSLWHRLSQDALDGLQVDHGRALVSKSIPLPFLDLLWFLHCTILTLRFHCQFRIHRATRAIFGINLEEKNEKL